MTIEDVMQSPTNLSQGHAVDLVVRSGETPGLGPGEKKRKHGTLGFKVK